LYLYLSTFIWYLSVHWNLASIEVATVCSS